MMINNDKKDTSAEIDGDFDFAVRQLISDLIDGKKSHSDMLYRWDQARGADWITSTIKRKTF